MKKLVVFALILVILTLPVSASFLDWFKDLFASTPIGKAITPPEPEPCSNACTSGQTRCVDSIKQTCRNYDTDTCLEWPSSTTGIGNTPCEYGCSNGVCNPPPCLNECTSGQTRCNNNYLQNCGSYDADTCLEWGGDVLCDYGCSNNQCNAPPPTTEISCTNGIDDDNDGAIDSVDKDCGESLVTIYYISIEDDEPYYKNSLLDVNCEFNLIGKLTTHTKKWAAEGCVKAKINETECDYKESGEFFTKFKCKAQEIGNVNVLCYVNENCGTYAPTTQYKNIIIEELSYCKELNEDWIAGELIEITKFDKTSSKSRFYPGDEIEAEVKVKNNDAYEVDVEINLGLFNLDEGEFVDEFILEDEIEEDKSKEFTLSITVPDDADEDDTYLLFARAFQLDDDYICADDNIEIEIKERKKCDSDSDCRLDEICKNRECIKRPVTPTECKSNADCTIGVCDIINKKCVECLDNEDCLVYGNNYECIANKCEEIIQVPITEDSDNDGLPDTWELEYFGSLTVSSGSQDYDKDGVSDYDEYIQGSDPTEKPKEIPWLIIVVALIILIVSLFVIIILIHK